MECGKSLSQFKKFVHRRKWRARRAKTQAFPGEATISTESTAPITTSKSKKEKKSKKCAFGELGALNKAGGDSGPFGSKGKVILYENKKL